MRILRVVLLLPVALASLAGCTPADEPLTALAVLDGKPTIVSVGCGLSHSSIQLYEDPALAPTPMSPSIVAPTPSISRPAPSTSSPNPSSGCPGVSTGATADDDSPSWSISTSDPRPVNEIE